MKLIKYEVEKFIGALSSDSPAPGGGSASALAGSVGAALTVMVANLTTGREKFRAKEPLVQEIRAASQALTQSFLELIDQDTEAFNGVAAVFKMPKTTAEEQEQRRQAMEAALKQATIVPFSIMENAAAALRLLTRAVNNTNPSALSDLGVAGHCLTAAVNGGWLNVLINLVGIKDQAFVRQYREKGRQLLAECTGLSQKLQQEIETALEK